MPVTQQQPPHEGQRGDRTNRRLVWRRWVIWGVAGAALYAAGDWALNTPFETSLQLEGSISAAEAGAIAVSKLTLREVDQLYPGLPATVIISAPSLAAPVTYSGTVARVSMDARRDEQTGAPFYLAYIHMAEQPELMSGGEPAGLQTLAALSGVSVKLHLVTGTRTLLSRLLWYLAAPSFKPGGA